MGDGPSTKMNDLEVLVADLLCEQIESKASAFDDGSKPSMVDWHLELANGARSCLEVTSHLDQEVVAQSGALRSHGVVLRDLDGIDGRWMATLEPRARVDRAHAELPGLLVSGRSHGIRECSANGCTGQAQPEGYREGA